MSASSSSSLLAPGQWKYDVFPSFSGQDVRRNFLSHLLGEFKRKGINTFVDDQIRRSESIGPELVRAIRASRIGLVILTKNYASSSWCLDELLEIMECGQKVMTVFYDMNPSDVRRQRGDFGMAFERTCEGKTEEQKQRWSQALTNAANIVGEHSHNWDSEAAMMLKIATDISNMLNLTPSRDFDHLVGIEAHIAKMNSLLCMGSNKVKVVGIWGPAGIGKTTIARALYNRVSRDFQLSVFMENVKGSYNNDSYSSKLRLQEHLLSELLNLKDMRIDHLGVAEKRLNSQKVFIVLDDVDKLGQLEALANERHWFGDGSTIIVTTEQKDLFKGYKIDHIYEVNFPSANEALQIFSQSAFKQDSPPEGFMELAAELTAFTNHLPLGLCVLGSSLRGKSRIEWTHEVPILKSRLHGDIEKILRIGYDGLGDDIEKTIFLHIACLFDGEEEDRVIQLLENSIRHLKYGLGVLVERALVYISSDKRIMMHHLLRKMGREIVRRQSAHEPGKRQFLIDAQEIHDVLSKGLGTRSVLGISFNMSDESRELFLRKRAFSGMHNLQFLRFYEQWPEKAKLHLHESLDCLRLPRKLKVLHWEACPMRRMSSRFRPECLVEINMKESKLKKLWEGIPVLRSLKKMELIGSTSLEELPDLSEAINLEYLDMKNCHSLLKLPPSIWKLNMLDFLRLEACKNLEPLPANYALESLSFLNISYCPKLKDFPEISTEIEHLDVSFTAIPEVPPSIDFWDCLHTLDMNGCENVTEFPLVPYTVSKLHLSSTGIQEVPSWISDLYALTELTMLYCSELRKISPRICELGQLQLLNFNGCRNVKKFPAEIFQSFSSRHGLDLSLDFIGKNSLPTFRSEETHDFPLHLSLFGNDFESIPHYVVPQVHSLCLTDCIYLRWLPELPGSLSELEADNCVALESLSPPFRSSHDPKLVLKLVNCSKLDQQARKLVVEQWACGYAVLPGSKVPNYFTHRARGSSLTIHLDRKNLHGSLRFKACVVLPPSNKLDVVDFRRFKISCYVRGRHSNTVYKWPEISAQCRLQESHLFILNSYFTLEEDNVPESEMLFIYFKCLESKEFPVTVSSRILRCGVKLLEPCSCEYDSKAHPELSTLPLEDDEGNNNNTGETSRSKKLRKMRSKKREGSSVAEGPERSSKNLRIGLVEESVDGPAKKENSRRDKRKEARLQKNQKKHEYWLQRQKLQKEKRVSSSVQKTGDVIKSENFQQTSDSETEHVKSVSPSGNKDDGKPLTQNKGEDRVKSKEKKMQRVDRMKDLKKPKKTKFEEMLEMEAQSGLVSREEDVELERKLAKKLKVNKGKLRGLDDGMNELFEGLPSVLDSMGSELGDSSRKKRKRKTSEDKQDDEAVDKQANEVLEHEESAFSDEASEEEPTRKRDRKQRKKKKSLDEESDFSDEASEEEPTSKKDRKQRKKKKSVDEELESHPMKITDRGESETVSYDDSPSTLEKVESPLQENPQSSIKYVAPRFRSQARSEPEEHTKLRTRIKGLLNKMAESNVETITAELSSIYRTVARSVSSQIFCEEVLATYARGNEQYSVFAAFIAGMACLVGMDFSAKLIASLAKSFEDEYQQEDSLSLNGITLLLSYLCILGVCSSDLIYDFLMTLGKRLTEVDASTILTVLDCCGMKIRSDDPVAMKTFIISIQNKTTEIKTSPDGQPKINNYTMEKMLETISAIKNNKLRAKDESVQNTRVKKWLQKLRVEEVLLRGLTWSKLLDPEKKGQWWLSGDLAVKSNNAEDVAQTMDADVVEAQKMLKLADAQRMNTDSRKAIFCVIMSSEDYIDAFEKLLRLDLPGKQDREIVRVLLECCLQEKVFNKYYTVLASKLCAHDKNHKFTLQYCIWDHFKELESMSLQRSMNLAKFVAEMIVSFNLSLAVLKSVDLANPVQLTPKRIMHFRMLFEAIFEHPENLVWNLFTRIALNPDYEALRDGIKFFMKEYVVKANKTIFGKFRKAKAALNNAEGLLM